MPRGDCRARRRAFTLVELLIALAITSVIGAATVSMLFATTRATEVQRDVRGSIIRQQSVYARLKDRVNTALAFLGADDDQVVLWLADDNEDGFVNLGELGLLEYDAANDQLLSYSIEWPGGWSQSQIDGANTQYSNSDNFITRAENAKATGYFPSSVWASDVTAMTFTLDPGAPLTARVLTVRTTFSTGLLEQEFVSVCGLRTHVTPD